MQVEIRVAGLRMKVTCRAPDWRRREPESGTRPTGDQRDAIRP